MKMGTLKAVATLAAAVVVFLPANSIQNMEIKVEYFSSHTFPCDDLRVNVTEQIDNGYVSALYWMLPTGELVMTQDDITESNIKLQLYKGLAYNLTLSRINDINFGYYICIVTYSAASPQTRKLDAIRWGLNINGADFSALQAQYAQSAIVGAIAAAVMLGLLGTVCILWHFRYSARHGKKEKLHSSGLYDKPLDGYNNTGYVNSGLNMEEIEIQSVPELDDKSQSNGPPQNSVDMKL